MRAMDDEIAATEPRGVEILAQRETDDTPAGHVARRTCDDVSHRLPPSSQCSAEKAVDAGDEYFQSSALRSLLAIRMAFAMMASVRFLAGSLVKQAPSQM